MGKKMSHTRAFRVLELAGELTSWPVSVQSLHEIATALNNSGYLVDAGTEVHESDLRRGDLYRVEFDLSRPKNWLEVVGGGSEDSGEVYHTTTEARYNGYTTAPYHYAQERVSNRQVFLLERAEIGIPREPGVHFMAKTGDGPVEWAFITRADGAILCVDERDMNGQTWTHQDFSNKFTVTAVL